MTRPPNFSSTNSGVLVLSVWRRSTARSAAFTDTATATSMALRHGGRVEVVADTTGLDSWRDHAAGYRAGHFHVRPPWIGPDSTGRFVDVVIDPGHAFGSGSHPTTRLMLTALAEHIGPGDRVVDLGTGSGILAIAAARLGADVIGIDLDPAAAPAVQTNAMANGVRERVDVRIGDISDIGNDERSMSLCSTSRSTSTNPSPLRSTSRRSRADRRRVLDGEQAERAARLHGRSPPSD